MEWPRSNRRGQGEAACSERTSGRRSKSSSAKDPSLAAGLAGSRRADRRHLHRAPSRWTSRSASAAFPAAASSRSSGRNPPARPPSRCRSSPRPRRPAAWRPSSTSNTRSIPVYAQKLGVDVDNLLVSQPDYGEQALEITDALIASGSIDVLVVDSVAALVPKAELDGEMGDSFMGVQARLMSQAMRKLTGIVSKSQHLPDLHQPDPRKDRRHVRQPGNHHRRPRAEVLFLASASISAASPPSRTATPSSATAPRSKIVKNKVAAAVPRGRVRHHVRRRHLARKAT